MTASPFVGPTVQMPPPFRHPRPARRPRPHLVPAVLIVTCVVGGLVTALVLAPRPPTPGNVARAFVQAGFDQDWSAMRRALCRGSDLPDARGSVGPRPASDGEAEIPVTSLVVVRDVIEEPDRGPLWFRVTLGVAVTGLVPDDGAARTHTVVLPVVGEDGEFRVCFRPG